MARRFSRLKFAIDALKTSGQTGIPTLPQGSALDGYQKYIAGDTQLTINRTADSLPGELLTVGVKPFGYENDTANIVPVLFSKRVNDESDLTTVKTASAHQDPATAVLNLEGFEPAKAIVTQTTGTNASARTSAITGRSYKAKDKESFTFPFGQTGTTADFESTARNRITTAVLALSGNFDVSFKPEKI